MLFSRFQGSVRNYQTVSHLYCTIVCTRYCEEFEFLHTFQISYIQGFFFQNTVWKPICRIFKLYSGSKNPVCRIFELYVGIKTPHTIAYKPLYRTSDKPFDNSSQSLGNKRIASLFTIHIMIRKWWYLIAIYLAPVVNFDDSTMKNKIENERILSWLVHSDRYP